MYGIKQTLDTLINEEALLFAQYLRNEKKTWIPRAANLRLWTHTVEAKFRDRIKLLRKHRGPSSQPNPCLRLAVKVKRIGAQL